MTRRQGNHPSKSSQIRDWNENVAPAIRVRTNCALAIDLFSKTLSVAGILLVASENLGPDIVTPWR